MQVLTVVTPVVAPVMLATAAGYGWKRLGQAFDHAFVTRLITNLGAPCLVFATLSQSRLSMADLGAMALGTVACLAWSVIFGFLGLRFLGQSRRVFLPSLVFANIGNIGLPVCQFAFGQDGLSLAMIYFTISSLLQFTIGEAIAAGQFRIGKALKVPFLHAALLALLFSLSRRTPPDWLTNATGLIGGMTVPLMLMALGVALAELKVGHLKRAGAVALGRMALGLSGAGAVIFLFGFHGASAGVLMAESIMPVAALNYLFARLHNCAPEEVAGSVVASTLLTFLCLPLLVSLAMSLR